jgi:hypothetical protein
MVTIGPDGRYELRDRTPTQVYRVTIHIPSTVRTIHDCIPFLQGEAGAYPVESGQIVLRVRLSTDQACHLIEHLGDVTDAASELLGVRVDTVSITPDR